MKRWSRRISVADPKTTTASAIHIRRLSLVLLMSELISHTKTLLAMRTAVALKMPSNVCVQLPICRVSPLSWYVPKNNTRGKNSRSCFMVALVCSPSARYPSGYVRQFGQFRSPDRLLTGARRSVEIALIDFHTHSNASDGALSPSELLHRAAEAGVKAVALTDHDTIAGFVSVSESVPLGVRLVSGVELSCQWGKVGIHVVGLGFDATSGGLVAHLNGLDSARLERAEMIAHRLAQRGMPGALEGAMAV